MTPLARDMSFANFKPGKELAELIGDRSPGERPEGALVTTKPARKKPEQSALAKPLLPDEGERIFYFAAPTPEFDPGPILNLSPDLMALNMNPAPPGFGGPQNRNSFIVPQGEGTTPTPTPTPSAVPEPAIWVNFIVGFGLLGSQLRRRRSKAGTIPQL